jgi:hypothetical protein
MACRSSDVEFSFSHKNTYDRLHSIIISAWQLCIIRRELTYWQLKIRMTANCLKKGKYIHSCFLSFSLIYWGQKQVVIILLYSSLQIADLVSLSKQRFEQVGMKTHVAKAICDKVQKLYTNRLSLLVFIPNIQVKSSENTRAYTSLSRDSLLSSWFSIVSK